MVKLYSYDNCIVEEWIKSKTIKCKIFRDLNYI